MSRDPELIAHLEWLGYIQPVGLVVSAPALLQAQAHVNSNVIPQHQRFLGCLPVDKDDQPIPQIEDFPAFVRQVLDWQETDLIAFEKAQAAGIDVSSLEVVLPEYNETLRPTWVVPEFRSASKTRSTSGDFVSVSKSIQYDQRQEPDSDALGLVAERPVSDWETTKLDTVTPTAAPSDPKNADRFVMLIQEVPTSQDLDEPMEESDRRWHASPHARFERLLRETQVPAGLLTNGRSLRLVYAPRGETSGYLTFNVDEMMTVAGRPIFAALHMLLNSDRLFNLEKKQRLPAILLESRKYQNTVSTQLAQQVMAALYEMLRGFQAADDQWNGRLLHDVLAKDPQHVYHGLLTVLMRTVFILYAEDRNLLSSHPVYTNHYSISGLFERLRSDAGQYPDTMDQRYGAWAQLLTLFRMIYEGGNHDELSIPARKGYLFDPERYLFLEGNRKEWLVVSVQGLENPPESLPTNHYPLPTNHYPPIPRISDGVVYRVLSNLLILDGERLSYRSLDVEQIGSVYEAIMGFEVKVSSGRSIAIKPAKTHGAPVTINLEELLAVSGSKRTAWLSEHADQDLSSKASEALKSASSIEELLSALGNKIANNVTPNVVPGGAMIFQPSDERRRSGSHYTPRSLTEPIVRRTLEPILKQLYDPAFPVPDPYAPTKEDKLRYTTGELASRVRQSERSIEQARQARDVGTPHPSQILDLKICDPAMGSGAFLVEACRQLGDELIKAWYAHDAVPTDIPPDEDEVLYARRMIAQRCLYGVDKNAMAVDLAKLSLWLVTLAKDHAFTFLDHALHHGDSLIGLTRDQIIGFHWEPKKQKKFGEDLIQKRLDRATEARAKILNAREDVPYRDQEQRLALANDALNVVRLTGDACVSAFFVGSKPKEREARCAELYSHVSDWYTSGLHINKRGSVAEAADDLRSGEHPIPPFHWEIEFPEVFARENGGFDAFVGNPPFAGKNNLINGNRDGYLDWLKEVHSKSHGNSDLVAHFFRLTYARLRNAGAIGLIATKTIRQGDTRTTGLLQLRNSDATIYHAIRQLKWPGEAAVTVSVVHLLKGKYEGPFILDGKSVPTITAFLFHAGGDEDPQTLSTNSGKSFIGHFVCGPGFLFDDRDNSGLSSTTEERKRLIGKDSRNAERIFPYIGGEEVLNSPTHAHARYVINFEDFDEAKARTWPDLIDIVERNVKPERVALPPKNNWNRTIAARWWQFGAYRKELRLATAEQDRVLFHPNISTHLAFAFLPTTTFVGAPHNVIALNDHASFGSLQSRVHEAWARFFASSLEERLRYTPTDCFETFPFPPVNDDVREIGRKYYELRSKLLLDNDEGLTKTYNRFHDPHEQAEGILELRRLHSLMDGAVLKAYGWDDLAESARCEFLLDYEEDSDEGLVISDQSENSSLTTNHQQLTTTRRRRLPWRYRWPDDFRDEVLARLLELNEQRHKEELLAASSQLLEKKEAKETKKRKAKNKISSAQQELDLDGGDG